MTSQKRPAPEEAAPYYFTYIDRVPDGDIAGVIAAQRDESAKFFSAISEEKSLHRYAPGKWSIREALNHVNDAERLFLSRAFWFARGFESPLPSFDEKTAVEIAKSDDRPWKSHVEEFRAVREATLTFIRELPEEAWNRGGKASDNFFTVRALAWIIAGHLIHHRTILKERYLPLRAERAGS